MERNNLRINLIIINHNLYAILLKSYFPKPGNKNPSLVVIISSNSLLYIYNGWNIPDY